MAYGAAGTVITGSPPACRVFNSAAISLTTSGTAQVITFDSERYKTQVTMHSTSANTSRIAISDPGLYHVFFTGEVAANATGNRQAYLRVNGATIICVTSFLTPSAAIGADLCLSTIYKFAANDYVEVLVMQSSGGALNLNAAAAYTPEFGATWVGLGT